MEIWSLQNEQTYPWVQTVTDTTIKHNIPYNWSAFLSVNDEDTFLYALIRIRYQGSHSNAYNIVLN